MINNIVHNNEILKMKLFDAMKQMGSKPLLRFMKFPWKTLYSRLMKYSGRNKEVKVRTFWGTEMNVILPEDVSTNIWKYGFFDEDVCLFMLSSLCDGMTFIDIGSHFGFFSLLGSYLVGQNGKVLAFEPAPSTHQQLQKNIQFCSEYLNVETLNCAAYSEDKWIEFYDYGLQKSAYNSAFGSRVGDESQASNKTIQVPARKIDDVLTEMKITNVALVKIDAESSEIHVLNGMTETLKYYKPNIIIEVGDFEVQGVPKSIDIITWLHEMDYLPYEIRNNEIAPHQVRQDHYKYGNLLFVAKK